MTLSSQMPAALQRRKSGLQSGRLPASEQGKGGEQQKGKEGKFDDHQNSVNVVQVSFRSIALC